MKKLVGLLLLIGTGCASVLFLNSFRFFDSGKFTALSSPTPSVALPAVSQASPSSSSSVAKTPVPTYKVGQTVTVNNMDLKVVGVKPIGKSLTISNAETLEASGTWQVVTFDVTNSDKYDNSLANTEFVLKDSKGETYPSSQVATAFYSTVAYQEIATTNHILALPSTQLPSSATARIHVLFDVAQNAENLQLMIKPSFATANVTVRMDLE